MSLRCVRCGDYFEGYILGNEMCLCNKCKRANRSNADYSATSGYHRPNQALNQSIIYQSERDIIINAKDNKVAQIKKFVGVSVDDINKWLIENNVKEVTSFNEQNFKDVKQWAGGGSTRMWTEITIIYNIEV